MSRNPLRLAVLISGGGRTLLNIHEHIQSGKLNARIQRVVSSRTDVAGVQRARAVGLPTTVLERRTMSPEAFQRAVTEVVADAELVCMAGFLSLWSIPPGFHGRVMNIHPALLPEFGGKGMFGRRVHEAVLAAGKKISGCTVHFCDDQYDHGPIILQRTVPVFPNDTPDTLASRVFEQERIAYPEAIRLFAAGRVRLEKGRVVLAGDGDADASLRNV